MESGALRTYHLRMAARQRTGQFFRTTGFLAVIALGVSVNFGQALAQEVRVEAGTAIAVPGGEACVPIFLESGNESVVGISNDIGIDAALLSISPAVDCELGPEPLAAGLQLECNSHPALVRCGVFNLSNTVIPDGLVYQCCFTVAATAPSENSLLLSNTCGAANLAGDIPALCTDGNIQVTNATPTPTAPATATVPSATPTATHTPTAIPADTSTPLATTTPDTVQTSTPANTATRTPTVPISEGRCPGDCNGDGRVTINELVTAVNIALGNQSVLTCVAVDENGDQRVTINELIRAVNSALLGCDDRMFEIPGRCEMPGPSGPEPCDSETEIELFGCSDPSRCLVDGGDLLWRGTCDSAGRFTALVGAAAYNRILIFRARVSDDVFFRALDLSMVGEPWNITVIDLASETALRLLATESFANFDIAGIRDFLLAVLRALEKLVLDGRALAEALGVATEVAMQDAGTTEALRCLRAGGSLETCMPPTEEWNFEFVPDPGQGCTPEESIVQVTREGASVSGRVQGPNCLQVSCQIGLAQCDEGVTSAELSGERSGENFGGSFAIHFFGQGRCPSQNCSSHCSCAATTDLEGTFAADRSSISGRYDFRAGPCTGGVSGNCVAGPCRHDRNRCVGTFVVSIHVE